MSTGARLLVIGLDGADHGLVGRMMAEGRLPVLSGLARHGACGPLRSVLPASTMPAWSTVLTGTNPGVHGLFDFVQRRPGRYRSAFTHGGLRAVPTFLRLLSDAGGRVAQLLVPSTWPPEPLNGVVVSGFDSPLALAAGPGSCHPPELWRELRDRFGGLAYAGFSELAPGPGFHARALTTMQRELARKEQVARWLLGRERWDAFAMVFGESDTAGHHLWMFHDPRSPRHPGSCDPELRGGLERIYERLDRSLARLLAWAQPELCCVLSDHGMGGAGRLAVYLNRFLEERGWLRFRSSSEPSLATRTREAALRSLPATLQERLFRSLPRSVVDEIESRARYGAIDFAHTRAFSDESSYAATVHLNVAGREPLGCVEDREAALAGLEEDLMAWRVQGQSVVAFVHRREALYRGPQRCAAPDLVLELALRDGFSTTPLPSTEVDPGTTHRWLDEDELTGGRARGMNGTHRREGILFLQGRGVAAGAVLEGADQVDVAPTLLTLVGHRPPAWMEGRCLLPGDAHGPLRSLPAASAPRARTPLRAEWGWLRQRLQRLGYLDGGRRP